MCEYVKALQGQLKVINKQILGARARGLDQPTHSFKTGDYVYIKTFSGKPLEEKWESGAADNLRRCQDKRTTSLDSLFSDKESS